MAEDQPQNKLVDLTKFFASENDGDNLIGDGFKKFKNEWAQLSEEEKAWFKAQPLS